MELKGGRGIQFFSFGCFYLLVCLRGLVLDRYWLYLRGVGGDDFMCRYWFMCFEDGSYEIVRLGLFFQCVLGMKDRVMLYEEKRNLNGRGEVEGVGGCVGGQWCQFSFVSLGSVVQRFYLVF